MTASALAHVERQVLVRQTFACLGKHGRAIESFTLPLMIRSCHALEIPSAAVRALAEGSCLFID